MTHAAMAIDGATPSDFDDRLARWHQRLLRPTELVLPTDYPRPSPMKVVEASHTFALPDAASYAVLQLSLAHASPLSPKPGATPASPYIVLLAAFAVLLNRYTSEEDIVIGSSSDTANPLVLRLTVKPEQTFMDVIDMVQRVEQEAIMDEVPFASLLASLTGKAHDHNGPAPAPPSFFRARFFNQTDTTADTLDQTISTNTDITVFITQQSTASLRQLLPTMQITISYNQVLFSADRIHHICDQLAQVLQASARVAQALEAHRSNPSLPAPKDTAVGAIDMVTTRCRQVIPDPVAPLNWSEWPGAITSVFAQNARSFPTRPCVVENVLVPGSTASVERTFTYQQVFNAARLLAVYFLKQGIRREDVVAIYAYRGVDLAIAIMGVLMAGATYSVIDPAYPPGRQEVYLTVAQPRGLIVLNKAGVLAESVRDYVTNNLHIIAEVSHLELQTNGTLLGGAQGPKGADVFDSIRNLSDAHLAAEDLTVPVLVGPDSIGTLSFTSGSTGIPKGVRGRHYSLTHFYPWMSREFGLSETDRFTMLSGIAHDPIQRDVFTPFFLGAELHIPTSEDIGIPGQLASWMAHHEVTVTHLTPAMGQLLSTNATTPIPTLANAFFVGDLLTKRDCHRLQYLAENVTIVNMYGTTETQRAVSYFAIPPRAVHPSFLSSTKDVIPAGKGMRSAQLLVVNRFYASRGRATMDHRPGLCGVGEVGEIYVRSGGLSEGYLRLDDVTSEKFVANWFKPDLDGVNLQKQPYLPVDTANAWPFYRGDRDRLYRSGDLGRYLPDGSVECVGRMDDQIKIRGFRIELGEIDNYLSQHPRVRANVTLVRRDKNEEKKLVSYFVPGADQTLVPSTSSSTTDLTHLEGFDNPTDFAALVGDIRDYLKHKLPSYSIPSVFVPLKRLPLTPNGKVDKAALPFPDTALLADKGPAKRTAPIPSADMAVDGGEEATVAPASDEGMVDAELADYTLTERTLHTIWQQVLDDDDVLPRDESFFDLGGHSILATRMIFQLRKTFGVDVPLGLMFQDPTIGGLAREIDRLTNSDLNIATPDQSGAAASTKHAPSAAQPAGEAGASDASNVISYAADLETLLPQLPPPLTFAKASSTMEHLTYTFPARIVNQDSPTFFLTGATGFLGAFIVAQLMNRCPSAIVYCLTRADSNQRGFERVKKSCQDHLVWQAAWGAEPNDNDDPRYHIGAGGRHVRAVRGDLAQPQLGINNEEWQGLAAHVDGIIHNGAMVHWLFPYERLRSANVLSTLAVLSLAATHHVKPLTFVSSTSVVDSDHYTQLNEFCPDSDTMTDGAPLSPGSQAGANAKVLESDDLEGSRYGLHSGYGQSKWVSEKLLFAARARGYPVTTVRPGYIVGDTKVGVTNTDDFLWRLVKGCIQLGKVPIINNSVNMCPVDYVARVVVEAATQPTASQVGPVFQTENPHRFRFNDFFNLVRIYGFEVEPVPYIPWRDQLMDKTLLSADNALYPLLQFVLDDLPTSTKSPELDISNTLALGQLANFTCTPMTSLIGMYLAYLVKTGFLDAPAPYDPEAPADHNQVVLIADGSDSPYGLVPQGSNQPGGPLGQQRPIKTAPRRPLPALQVEVGGVLSRSNRS
ncbi:large subunit of alpha-aminoadipate reductase [Dimargaris xerosporica]|nr:large subunit of alpha-aminoadipate reductase [Dimargaris xerosporica]